MTVNPTSIRAYLERVKSRGGFKPQRDLVMICILDHAPVTREQISNITGIKLSSVCGRVHSLIYPDPYDKTIKGPVKVAFRSTKRRIEYLEARWVKLEDEKLEQIRFVL